MSIIKARRRTALLAVAMLAATLSARAEKAPASAFEQQLKSQYVLAQASHFNRVSSTGTVVVIQQAGLSAAPPASLTGATAWYINTFKDGKRQNHFLRELAWQREGTLRPIEVGERFYVTKLDVKEAAITFYLVSSDQLEGRYYYAGVSFQFAKGYQSSLVLTDVQQVIRQVFTVEEQNQNTTSGQPGPQVSEQPGNTPPAVPPASFTPIATPPAPPQDAPAAPVEIAIGQTPEQVKAALGQPDRIIKAGAKEIYSYKNLKVTFVDGKVSDVE